MRAAIEHFEKKGIPVPKEIQKSSKVLQKLFNGPIPTWVDLLGEKLFTLANAKLPEFGAGDEGLTVSGGEVSFEQLKDDISLKGKLNQNIENLTNWLERSLKFLLDDVRIFLIFDRLDEAWVANFVEQSKFIISGLLHASEHVYRTSMVEFAHLFF
ncbi:hypothetical protein JJD66_23780 [Pseudomonas sp. MF6751]|uniref:hypothetical protein n=1 Tax=Pseudomonas sp. MF6751 TaxID=2797528 RepID=UPI00190CF040|nr:hypothetical protein [Pseudomonas sp. MF6751]MBK3479106.1 hypothetical protein [Pseudomonas sp. MF6751]